MGFCTWPSKMGESDLETQKRTKGNLIRCFLSKLSSGNSQGNPSHSISDSLLIVQLTAQSVYLKPVIILGENTVFQCFWINRCCPKEHPKRLVQNF